MINLFNINHYNINTEKFDHFLHGSIVKEFEDNFCNYVGAKHGCTVNSASSGIFLSLLENRDTVYLPSMLPTIVANVVQNSNNKIHFKDDINWVGDSYTLHDFGKYKIIDSAQKVKKDQFNLEANPEDLMIFSFYPTKPVGSIDGGIIVSNDYYKIKKLKEMSFYGMKYDKNSWDRELVCIGWKMYMNSIQAYIANENLNKLDIKLNRISKIRQYYNDNLGLNNISDHLYRISVDDNDYFIQYMKDNGIVCGVHYKPLHLNYVFSQCDKDEMKRTNKEYKRTISIPMHEKLSDSEVEYIYDTVKAYG